MRSRVSPLMECRGVSAEATQSNLLTMPVTGYQPKKSTSPFELSSSRREASAARGPLGIPTGTHERPRSVNAGRGVRLRFTATWTRTPSLDEAYSVGTRGSRALGA